MYHGLVINAGLPLFFLVMNLGKLTLKAQEALNDASAIAQKADHSLVETENLLLALFR